METSEPSSSHSPTQESELQHTASIPQRPNNNGPFPFTPDELMTLIDPKSPEQLGLFGGAEGILAGIHADPVKGLTTSHHAPLQSVVEDGQEKQPAATPAVKMGDIDTTVVSFVDREEYFGRNVLPKRKPKSIFQLMWDALQEKILVSIDAPHHILF